MAKDNFQNQDPPIWALDVQQKWIKVQILKKKYKNYFCMFCENIGNNSVRMCGLSQQRAIKQSNKLKKKSKHHQTEELDHIIIFQHRVKIIQTPEGLEKWTKHQKESEK